MKYNLTLVKHLALGILTLLGIHMQAATYTAIQSGSWSSSTTWLGGTAPGASLTGSDIVIIPSGITVTMDQDETVNNNLSYITVNGTLNGAYRLSVSNGTLAGAGTLEIQTLWLDSASALPFTGSVKVDNLYNRHAQLSPGGNIEIGDTLALLSGMLNIDSGILLTLDSNVTIKIAGGGFTLADTLRQIGKVNLYYTGSSTINMGAEARLASINDLTILLSSATNMVNMTSNLDIKGKITISRGRLSMNGYNLISHGKLSMVNGGGYLMGDSASSLYISGSGNAGNLAFANGYQCVNFMFLALDSNGTLSLSTDFNPYNGLTVNRGTLKIGDHILTVADGIHGPGYLSGTRGSELRIFGSNSMGMLNWNSNGDTLGKLSIDIVHGFITMTTSLKVMDSLNLSRGRLVMNGQHLTIGGAVSTNAMGMLAGDTAASLTLTGSAASGRGTIAFDTSGQYLQTLELNMAAGAWVDLTSSLDLTGNLSLSGGNLNLTGANNLKVSGHDSIVGGSADSYVMTSGTGSLWLMVNDSTDASNARTFPIGTQAAYAPVRVRNNAMSGAHFGANAHSGIYENGTSGNDIYESMHGIGTSWNLSSDSVRTNISLEAYWSQNMQASQFYNSNVYISHYTGGAWDTYAARSARTQPGNMYSAVRTGVTSLSPFAVFSSDPAGVTDIGPLEYLSVYPNPATGQVKVNIPAGSGSKRALLHDVLGNQVAAYDLAQTTSIDLSYLTPGVYYLSVGNKHTERIVKQ